MSKSKRKTIGKRWARVHATLIFVWIALTVPTVILWPDSILWLAFMSIWANVYTAVTAWQAARAEGASEDETEKLHQHYD